jgi:hypothetical protein
MSEFVLRESEFAHLSSLLLKAVGFSTSPEYRGLRAYETDITGVVCGAFVRFFLRLHLGLDNGASGGADSQELVSAHRILEMLASSSETAVRSLVTDEIFESFEDAGVSLEGIERRLHANARALYDAWRAGPDPSRWKGN